MLDSLLNVISILHIPCVHYTSWWHTGQFHNFHIQGTGSLGEKMDTLFSSPSAFQIPVRTESQSGDTVSLASNIF